MLPAARPVPVAARYSANERPCAPEALERPNTRPSPASVPEPAMPRRLPRFSQPVPEKPAEPSPLVWRSSLGISPMKRETGFACVWPKICRCWAQVRHRRLRARVMAT